MTPAPKISVIVPVYNVAPYVGECLSSLVHQTFTDFEIIAVNDGSTDGSLAVLREFERSYPMVHVIDQPNSGVSRARQAVWLRQKASSSPLWTVTTMWFPIFWKICIGPSVPVKTRTCLLQLLSAV